LASIVWNLTDVNEREDSNSDAARHRLLKFLPRWRAAIAVLIVIPNNLLAPGEPAQSEVEENLGEPRCCLP
jgi:hypothetical protein